MPILLLPRTDEAIDFLKKLRPEGPWILTSIVPNKGQITTQTFTDVREMSIWIDKFQNNRNIYYTLNTVKEAMSSKPLKTSISEMIALHVDVDPRVGEEISEERVRIHNLLMGFVPHPSIIVDSGSGYQAIFLLEKPVPLDGTIEMVEEYERYNRQLEILLASDQTFNLDRILRLPGTINIPDEKKLKKGRIAAIASVVEYEGTQYPLTAFIQAPTRIQTVVGSKSEVLPGGAERIKLSGNLAPLYVDNLDEKGILINDHIKALIIHGENDIIKQYSSRSEALFAVVCALVKAGTKDDDIAGILMNRENKISASVLDKPRPDRYCAKQIQNAKEELDDPLLRKLNEKFAVIGDLGGRCRIISEAYDHALKRARISFSSFEDFKNRFLNQRVEVARDKENHPVYKPAGTWWLTHPQRRQYDTIVFAPGKEISGAYNLWGGFACEALPGDCSLFLEHIQQNICKDNKEYYEYLISWMARCAQQPDCPGEVAVVMRGEQGTGKGALAKHFGSLFGRHFLQVSDPKHLVGAFNSHLRDCIVLMADEAFYAGDKKHESVLKSLVTESNLTIEAKGIDVVAAPNYTHIIMASNASWVVPAGSNERRFFVLDVSDKRMQDKKYFAAIQRQMDSGGREALLHMLLSHDITNFEVRDFPQTIALQDQKLLSYSNEESWWYEKLEEGRLLPDSDNWETEVMKKALQDDYILFMQRIGIMRKASSTILGKYLCEVCPGEEYPKSFQKMAEVKTIDSYGGEHYQNKRMYFYGIPTLEECRAHWDKFRGGPFKWSVPIKREEPRPKRPSEELFK